MLLILFFIHDFYYSRSGCGRLTEFWGLNGGKIQLFFPDRLSEMLSAILKENVRVKRVLPNESNCLTAEGSLLIMDILAELMSDGLANVEI